MNWFSNKRFLITGCGGDIGQSICKVLKEYDCYVAGVDIHNKHPGTLLYDAVGISGRADADNYFELLESFVSKWKIDVIIPMSEAEIRLFNKKRVKSIKGAPVLMANHKSMDIGFDKLVTAQFLKENNEDYPWTIPVSEGKPKEVPCMLKDKAGHGSRSIIRIEEGLVDYYAKKIPEAIWQELLQPDDQEYTCGVFSDGKEVRSIILHRDLVGGLTGYAEFVENKEITELLHRLADKLELVGSINVQLRLTDRGPIVFEINPRFSSTVQFRHKVGFQDLLWSLELAFGKKMSPYENHSTNIRIYRGSKLYILKEK